jgi:spoIIIJ-associated protein
MTQDLSDLAKDYLESLLTYFGVNAHVTVSQNDQAIELAVDSDTTGRLIGHRGETLAALQQLLNSMVRHKTGDNRYVSIDIANYKKARAEQLAEKVRADARRVSESGEPVRLHPMNAAERRVVHMTLAEVPEVTTESEGDGPERRVVIKPTE